MKHQNFMRHKGTYEPYTILRSNPSDCKLHIYPFFRDPEGLEEARCISPNHGRSFIVGRTSSGRHIVSKGNGLSYTQHQLLNTREMGSDTWGLLLLPDAERDFILGQEIQALGIKTNNMEYIIELDKEIMFDDGKCLKPILLQYDVECPFRICDAAFMTKEEISSEVEKWKILNHNQHKKNHLIAAEVVVKNLRILHDNNILHNAIHEQNYTWALELLDFELACSPQYPYTSEDSQRHAKDLFPREIIHSYRVVNYIAQVLREDIDYSEIDAIFNKYDFNLSKFKL